MFDDFVLSHKIKARKPEQKPYKIALKKARCKASECIFIEDKKVHCVPAKKMGMHTIVFTSQRDLIKRLKQLKAL